MNDELRSRTTESASMTIQDGDVRAAVLSLIQNDDDIMKKMMETVTQAIIKKLMESPNFLEKLANKFLKNGVLDNIKQDIMRCRQWTHTRHDMTLGEACCRLGTGQQRATGRQRHTGTVQPSKLPPVARRLRGADRLRQGSPVGVQWELGLQLTSDCIDRSHRLGHRHNNGSSNGKPRPIIVKLKSIDLRCKAQTKRYTTGDYR